MLLVQSRIFQIPKISKLRNGVTWATTEGPPEACGSLWKPTETLRKPYRNPMEILRKFWRDSVAKSYGNPTEILRKPTEASAGKLKKLRKLIEIFPAETIFTLRKPDGSPAEALRKAFSKIKISA